VPAPRACSLHEKLGEKLGITGLIIRGRSIFLRLAPAGCLLQLLSYHIFKFGSPSNSADVGNLSAFVPVATKNQRTPGIWYKLKLSITARTGAMLHDLSRPNAVARRPDRRRVLGFLSGALCVTVSTALTKRHASAAWPERPVRLVVPFAAGGPPDFVARLLADPLAAELGGTVVVDNRPGAGGTTGVSNVARSAPDGYTLLICTSAYILNRALSDLVSYDPVKDFTPICEIANAPNVFVVNAQLGVASLKEFAVFARSQPNGVSYSSPGTGTTPQLSVRVAPSAGQYSDDPCSLQ